jgi:hypothetical protein
MELRSKKLCTFYITRLKRRCNHIVPKGYRRCYQHRKVKYPRPPDCPVCTNTLARYHVPLNPCQHWVCPDCIIRSGKEQCPLCRSNIKVSSKNLYMLRLHSSMYQRYILDEFTGDDGNDADANSTDAVSSSEIRSSVSEV